MLDGVFVFCIIDIVKKLVYIGRDIFGIRLLFILLVVGKEIGILVLSFEVKGFVFFIKNFEKNGDKIVVKLFFFSYFVLYSLLIEG